METVGMFAAKEYLNRTCRICREVLAPHSTRSPVYKSTGPLIINHLEHMGNNNNLEIKKGSEYELIAPCRCSGTVKWVHRMCLDSWRNCCYRTEAYYRCEQCQTSYEMEASFGNSLLKNGRLLNSLAVLSVVIWLSIVGYGNRYIINTINDGRMGLGEGGGYLRDEFWNNIFQRRNFHFFDSLIAFGETVEEVAYENKYFDRNGNVVIDEVNSKYTKNSKMDYSFYILWILTVVNALIGASFMEWIFFNPSFASFIYLFITWYRYSFHGNSFDIAIMTGSLGYSLYYIYGDVYYFVEGMLRKLTCTRIKDLSTT